MNTLIAYATKNGSTEKCAKILSQKLAANVDLCNLKNDKNYDLSKYDKVIIGSSIYIGQIRKETKKFCENNLDDLKSKKLGVFICCMGEGEEALGQIENAFPKELLENAVAKDYFGGEFIFDKMSFLEKFAIKMVSKNDKNKEPVDTKNNISNILEESIDKFALKVNNA